MNEKHYKNKKQSISLDTMVFGKIPPQAIEMEKAVLGAVMLQRNALAEVQDLLAPEKFYLDAHQCIYRAILDLDAKSQAIDILQVVEHLKSKSELERVGGPYAVTQLTNSVVSAANISSHARIIVQKWMSRKVIEAGGDMVAEGFDDSIDPFDLLDRAEKSIAGIMDSNDRGRVTPIAMAMARGLTRLAKLRQQETSLTGIPSGFNDLDRLTHGWQDTDLIILAARPAVGKTAFALNLLRNAAIGFGVPSAFFSLEMSEGQLIERLMANETGVYLDLIKTGRLDDPQMEYMYKNGFDRLSSSPIFIDDTPALNIFELRAKLRRLKSKHKIGFAIIDYLQLMSGAGEKGNREQEISKISRDLKSLAKELQLPIIALSQLSRGVESRNDKTPQLSDLRESGAIEQDADMVMFLYRPEYYGITADENGESNKGETHVKIAKHRNGSLDTIKLTAELHIQRFKDFEAQPFTPPTPSGNWRPVRDILGEKNKDLFE